MEYGKQKTSASALVSSEILYKFQPFICDYYILLNVQLVKLKVFHSEEINQEEEPEARAPELL